MQGGLGTIPGPFALPVPLSPAFVPTLGLHTTEKMSVARGMYERMGFVRVPEFDFHPAPQVVVMAYRLDL